MKSLTKIVAESLNESVLKLSDLEAVSFKDLNVGDVISSGGMGGDPIELATVIDKQRLSMKVKVTHALGRSTKKNLGREITLDYSDTAEFGRVKKSSLSKVNESFVNEAKFQGKDILPSYYKTSQFGTK